MAQDIWLNSARAKIGLKLWQHPKVSKIFYEHSENTTIEMEDKEHADTLKN